MEQTTNYQLKKPAGNESAKIVDINDNMDVIDGLIKALQDAKASNTDLTTLRNSVNQHLEQKGEPNGYADLDETGKVPLAQLPPITDVQDATLTQKGITKLNGSVTSTADNEAATPSAVKSVNDRVSAISVGRNLFRGLPLNEPFMASVTASYFVGYPGSVRLIPIVRDTPYTFSCDYEVLSSNNATSAKVSIGLATESGTFTADREDIYHPGSVGSKGTLTKTFSIPSNVSSHLPNFAFRFNRKDVVHTSVVKYSNIKLYMGNVEIAWGPAHEDLLGELFKVSTTAPTTALPEGHQVQVYS